MNINKLIYLFYICFLHKHKKKKNLLTAVQFIYSPAIWILHSKIITLIFCFALLINYICNL